MANVVKIKQSDIVDMAVNIIKENAGMVDNNQEIHEQANEIGILIGKGEDGFYYAYNPETGDVLGRTT